MEWLKYGEKRSGDIGREQSLHIKTCFTRLGTTMSLAYSHRKLCYANPQTLAAEEGVAACRSPRSPHRLRMLVI